MFRRGRWDLSYRGVDMVACGYTHYHSRRRRSGEQRKSVGFPWQVCVKEAAAKEMRKRDVDNQGKRGNGGRIEPQARAHGALVAVKKDGMSMRN